MSYPESVGRINCYASSFVGIAIENYFLMKRALDGCIKFNDLKESQKLFYETEKKHIVCCVFSEMAIESFLNDYAAASLGDNEFYDEFGKLSVIGKFELISKFLLNKEFNKNQAVYTCLKTLVKDRNNYVHNKSFTGYFYNGVSENINIEYNDSDYERFQKEYFSEAKAKYVRSRFYIQAIVEITKMFEKNDKFAAAKFRMLCRVYDILDDNEKKYFSNEFKIKLNSKMH